MPEPTLEWHRVEPNGPTAVTITVPEEVLATPLSEFDQPILAKGQRPNATVGEKLSALAAIVATWGYEHA
jgi:hypothetical protein